MEARPRWGPKAASLETGWEAKLPASAAGASFGVGAGGQAERNPLLAEDPSRHREPVSNASQSTGKGVQGSSLGSSRGGAGRGGWWSPFLSGCCPPGFWAQRLWLCPGPQVPVAREARGQQPEIRTSPALCPQGRAGVIHGRGRSAPGFCPQLQGFPVLITVADFHGGLVQGQAPGDPCAMML